MAAVYTRANGSPIALLLYFDWNGSLLRRTVLNEEPEIQSLEIGVDGNVWALNSFDPENRSRFVFTEFDRNGAVVKQAVRSHRRWSTIEGSLAGGQTSFGIVSGKVWAWLPKTKTFISYESSTGQIVIQQTGFPPIDKSSRLTARQAALLPDGQLLMDIAGVPPKRYVGWFLWSKHSGWREVHHRMDNLCGVEGEQVIFLSSWKALEERLVFQAEPISDLIAEHQ